MPGQILIVDDQEFVRSGLRTLLSSCPEWTICGEAVDGLEAVDKANRLRPDVVLMDISMPRMNGIEATRIIRRDLPESKVVIITQNEPAVGLPPSAGGGHHRVYSKKRSLARLARDTFRNSRQWSRESARLKTCGVCLCDIGEGLAGGRRGIGTADRRI